MADTNPVVNEHHYHHEATGDSSAATLLTLLAVVLIVGILLFLFRVYPFSSIPRSTTEEGVNINVETPSTTPAPGTNPGATVYP
ncbi:MAG: hypothetical protein Q7R81_00880 [Candidatus Peregrinibacteria bacterium]|nr:hypothetical protein [Candidatus Peregrinibacteria bacterium]